MILVHPARIKKYVKQIMLSKEYLKQAVIAEGSSLREAMLSIKATALHMAVVVDSQKHVVGVISDGDIRKQLLIDEDIYAPVDVCMSRDFIYAREGCRREEILKLLDDSFYKIPILDKDGYLVDIVGTGAQNLVERPIETVGTAAGVWAGTRYAPHLVKGVGKLFSRRGSRDSGPQPITESS